MTLNNEEKFNQPKVEQIISYKFKNGDLLKQAMSHPSLRNNPLFQEMDNERLEFLGDAVVTLLVTELLYNKFTASTEGDLAKMRSYFISKEFLAQRAKALNLGEYLLMSGSEIAAGGRDNPSNLENVLEAIAGAVYLDGGLVAAKILVTELWTEWLNIDVLAYIDPKSRLQELLQAKNIQDLKYVLIETLGPAHAPYFTVAARVLGKDAAIGSGKTIKAAEKDAATKLLANYSQE